MMLLICSCKSSKIRYMKYSKFNFNSLMRTWVIYCFCLITCLSKTGSTQAGSVLPLRLLSFNAKNITENSILLEWRTIGENNTDYFSIEQSTNGITFTKIGYIKASGINPLNRYYSFTDRKPATGNNYYRLSMYDLDGSIKFSATQLIKAEGVRYLSVFPNPVNNSSNLNIYWKSGTGRPASITIQELTGRQIYEGKFGASGRAVISVCNWPSGIYSITLDNGHRKEFSKLVVCQ